MKQHPAIKTVRFVPACQHNSPTEGRCTADEVTNHYCQKHHEEAEARVQAYRKLRDADKI